MLRRFGWTYSVMQPESAVAGRTRLSSRCLSAARCQPAVCPCLRRRSSAVAGGGPDDAVSTVPFLLRRHVRLQSRGIRWGTPGHPVCARTAPGFSGRQLREDRADLDLMAKMRVAGGSPPASPHLHLDRHVLISP